MENEEEKIDVIEWLKAIQQGVGCLIIMALLTLIILFLILVNLKGNGSI